MDGLDGQLAGMVIMKVSLLTKRGQGPGDAPCGSERLGNSPCRVVGSVPSAVSVTGSDDAGAGPWCAAGNVGWQSDLRIPLVGLGRLGFGLEQSLPSTLIQLTNSRRAFEAHPLLAGTLALE